jgi:hypothetical protein
MLPHWAFRLSKCPRDGELGATVASRGPMVGGVQFLNDQSGAVRRLLVLLLASTAITGMLNAGPAHARGATWLVTPGMCDPIVTFRDVGIVVNGGSAAIANTGLLNFNNASHPRRVAWT